MQAWQRELQHHRQATVRKRGAGLLAVAQDSTPTPRGGQGATILAQVEGDRIHHAASGGGRVDGLDPATGGGGAECQRGR